MTIKCKSQEELHLRLRMINEAWEAGAAYMQIVNVLFYTWNYTFGKKK